MNYNERQNLLKKVIADLELLLSVSSGYNDKDIEKALSATKSALKNDISSY